MKNTLISMSLGMAGGMAIATYMLANDSTKNKACKMVNNAMDTASQALDDMKSSMKRK